MPFVTVRRPHWKLNFLKVAKTIINNFQRNINSKHYKKCHCQHSHVLIYFCNCYFKMELIRNDFLNHRPTPYKNLSMGQKY